MNSKKLKIEKIIILTLGLIIVLLWTSCSSSAFSFKIAIRPDLDSAVNLEMSGETKLNQNKVKIKNNRLDFHRGKHGYENLNIYFKGTNISKIKIDDINETFIYDNKEKPVLGIDFLNFYIEVNTLTFLKLWGNCFH